MDPRRQISHAEQIYQQPPVVSFTAPNAGPKTLSGTRTYVVGKEQAYILDPGPADDAYQQFIAEWIGAHKISVRGILLSHGHPDHAPGSSLLSRELNVPIWGSRQLDTSYFATRPEIRQYESDPRFVVDGDVLRVIPTPGHSGDHVAFFLENARILFAGDTILGQGSSLVAPPEGNMAEYMRTLDRLDALRANLIAPGHGPLIHDAHAKIEEYTRHRSTRESQLLQILGRGPATIACLVTEMYAGVNPELRKLASGSVAAQLEKLETEGRVSRQGEVYRPVSNPDRRE
ncbi:MAG: MBL fold metallo-hydrolase [Chloroflexota bacterium]